MAPGILDIPDEILESCLEGLLPLLKDTLSIATDEIHLQRDPELSITDDMLHITNTSIRDPAPPDLLHCRLVCRAFHRIATPFAWRRFKLLVDAPDSHAAHRDHTRAKYEYFTAHPAFAAHVRILYMGSRGTLIPGVLRRTLLPMLPVLRAMENLQVVLLRGAIDGPEVLSELLRRPRLHTFIMFEAYAPPTSLLDDSFEKPLGNIKNLNLSHFSYWMNVLKRTSQVEAFSLSHTRDKSFELDFSLPWATLRELELFEVKGWSPIAQNFSTWKQNNTQISSPLRELYIGKIYDPCISNAEVEHLLSAFHGQPLSKLVLYEVPALHLPLLTHIVSTFPTLEELTLFTNGQHVPWPGTLSRIIGVLRNLEHLQALDWNYSESENVWATPATLLLQFSRIVPVLGEHCPRLTSVKFSATSGLGDCAVFEIRRGAAGEYEGHKFQGRRPWLIPHSSAWHFSNYTRV